MKTKKEKEEKEKEPEIQEKDKEEIKSDSENRSIFNQEESDETISDHECNFEEEDQKVNVFSKQLEEREEREERDEREQRGQREIEGEGEGEREREQEVEMSLLDIKRKVQTEYDAQKEDTKQKKFRILNYSYKDSFAGKAEKKIFIYFCFICGYNCLISEVDIKKLPKRKTDKSIIFPLHKIVHKKNNKIHPDRILIKRGEKGVETQYRLLCKECNVPIGYITNLKVNNMFIYYYDYALLNDETKCHIFKYT